MADVFKITLAMSRRGTDADLKKKSGYSRSVSMALRTPGMGVNLWGESPLYENRKVFMIMDTNKSTSRRQGRLCEQGLVSIRTLWIEIHYPAKA